ncbi:hypothetical protein VKT23_017125 [Stygiomarasmius scandens]|uniref:Uncharacterized protein n=1 Tax=Marasmiellus scandens TaxID=2682957 RepID=A0ABR1IX17_9AGAR
MALLPQPSGSMEEHEYRGHLKLRRLTGRQNEDEDEPDEDEPDEDEPDEDESPVTRTRTRTSASTTGTSSLSTTGTSRSTGTASTSSRTTSTQSEDPQVTAGNPSGGSGGLSKGATAAIIILVLFFTTLLVFALLKLRRRRLKRAKRVYTVSLDPAAIEKLENRASAVPMLSDAPHNRTMSTTTSARTHARDPSSTTFAQTRNTTHTQMNNVRPRREDEVRSVAETYSTLTNPWSDLHAALPHRNPTGRIIANPDPPSAETSYRNSLSPCEPGAAYSPTGKERMSWQATAASHESGGQGQSKLLPLLPNEQPPAYDQKM